MKRFGFREIPCPLWNLALAGCLLLGWLAAAPTLASCEASPLRIYRLEIYDASPLQRFVHYDFMAPSVVRLYRVSPHTLISESRVIDLEQARDVAWYINPPTDRGRIRVGHHLLFQNIPPECGVAGRAPACDAQPAADAGAGAVPSAAPPRSPAPSPGRSGPGTCAGGRRR